MAEPAPKRETSSASTKPPAVDKQLVISVTSELRDKVEDYRFDKRYDSISAAVRHLIEVAMRVEGWEAKKRK